MLIAGAFYPNYFTAEPIDINEAEKDISLKDLKNTVMVKNLPNNEGILYDQKIREIFRICSNSVLTHFETTKVFIEFKVAYEHEQLETPINFGVYLAVLMRLLRTPLRLQRFTPKVTEEKRRRLEMYMKSGNTNSENMTIEKSKSGVVKFNIAQNLNNKLVEGTSELEETIATSDDEQYTTLNMTSNNEQSDNDEDNDHLRFITNSKKNKKLGKCELDTSRYLSCASVLNKHHEVIENSSEMNGSFMLTRRNSNQQSAELNSSIASSINANSSLRSNATSMTVPRLNSNRVTPGKFFYFILFLVAF